MTRPKFQTILQYLLFITLMFPFYGTAQGFNEHSLPYYMEQKTYPLLLNKQYDLATVTSVTGRINKLFYVEYYYSSGSFRIIGLELTTNQNETYQIHLAPLTWLEYNDVPIHKGAQLTVEGSIISLGHESILIAASLCWEGKRVNLRCQEGQWLWALPR